MAYYNRRQFLGSTAAVSFGASSGLLSSLAASSKAHAADTSGYKALVCLFFKGGMDGIDTLLPSDQPSYDALRNIRPDIFRSYGVGSGTSSRDRENLIELGELSNSGGRRFGLPPQMSKMADLYQAGDMAVVGNVGPLIEPVTRSSMMDFSARLPRNLFSHNDQQATWMSGGLEGQRNGWGAEFARFVSDSDPSSNRTFAAVTAGSSDVFLRGAEIQQFLARSGGVPETQIVAGNRLLGSARDSQLIRDILRRHFASRNTQSNSLVVRDLATTFTDARDSNVDYFNAATNGFPLSTAFPQTSLGSQLKVIAETINLRSALNVSRQVFYATLGGFDTHAGQANDLPDLQQEISDAVAAFQLSMTEMGTENDVTTFTAADFGRSLLSNGDGTDHGWGNHHFVIGGAVKGQNILGAIPEFDVNSESFTQTRARMIPSTSVDQYAATLGRWFGISDSELAAVLPNMNNFDSPFLDLF